MRLPRHDELVKAAARNAYEAEPSWFGKPTWEGLEREEQNGIEVEVRRYLNALLKAAVRLNVGGVVYDADGNCRNHIILRMEASDDK